MPSTSLATGAVSKVVIRTPAVASVAAGASTLRKVARRVRRPPSNRISASAIEPTSIGGADVVEFQAARAALAGQHAEQQEHQQQRRAEAQRHQARQDAGQDQQAAEQDGDADGVERGHARISSSLLESFARIRATVNQSQAVNASCPALVPGIHVFSRKQGVDGRDKPGHDCLVWRMGFARVPE